jgi:N-methylhydantoinase A/oxoprolinase/acetone carboxylase beta subunit
VWQPGQREFAQVPVYDGDRLGHGQRVDGPAIIESVNTTIVVPAGYRAEYDAMDNCLLGKR